MIPQALLSQALGAGQGQMQDLMRQFEESQDLGSQKWANVQGAGPHYSLSNAVSPSNSFNAAATLKAK